MLICHQYARRKTFLFEKIKLVGEKDSYWRTHLKFFLNELEIILIKPFKNIKRLLI